MSNAPSKPVSFSRPKVGYSSNRPRTQLTHTSMLRMSLKNVIRTSIRRIVYKVLRTCKDTWLLQSTGLNASQVTLFHTHCHHQGLHYNRYDRHVISPRKADPPSPQSFSGLLLYVHTIDMPEQHYLVRQPASQLTDMTT